MAWIPSHQTLRDHPKTRRAARMLGVSIPTMVGHLHLLWHWALDHAPDGDVSQYDDWDIADGAMWEGDAGQFLGVLESCGPAGTPGFIDNGHLRNWDQHGGRYFKRREAARNAAAVRWHSDGNANASTEQCDDDAEERRGEEKDTPAPAPLELVAPPVPSAAADDGFDDWWADYPRKVDKAKARAAYAKARRRNAAAPLSQALMRQIAVWKREGRPVDKIPHATTWLNGQRWEDESLYADSYDHSVNELGQVER